MTQYEQQYLEGLALGRLYWDDEVQLAWFESHRDKLHPLTLIKWSSVEDARQAIRGYAREAGLGGCRVR